MPNLDEADTLDVIDRFMIALEEKGWHVGETPDERRDVKIVITDALLAATEGGEKI